GSGKVIRAGPQAGSARARMVGGVGGIDEGGRFAGLHHDELLARGGHLRPVDGTLPVADVDALEIRRRGSSATRNRPGEEDQRQERAKSRGRNARAPSLPSGGEVWGTGKRIQHAGRAPSWEVGWMVEGD